MSEIRKDLRLKAASHTFVSGVDDDCTADELAYINALIETDERKRDMRKLYEEQSPEILVSLGDMTTVTVESVEVDAEYEAMTEDVIGNFNHIVSQGIAPIRALYAMGSGFAIVLGYCLRANMPFRCAQQLLTMVMKSATASEKLVRIITRQ